MRKYVKYQFSFFDFTSGVEAKDALVYRFEIYTYTDAYFDENGESKITLEPSTLIADHVLSNHDAVTKAIEDHKKKTADRESEAFLEKFGLTMSPQVRNITFKDLTMAVDILEEVELPDRKEESHEEIQL